MEIPAQNTGRHLQGPRARCTYVWGLAAFGQPAVEAVLAILRRELLTTMQQAGTVSVAAIRREFVVDRGK